MMMMMYVCLILYLSLIWCYSQYNTGSYFKITICIILMKKMVNVHAYSHSLLITLIASAYVCHNVCVRV